MGLAEVASALEKQGMTIKTSTPAQLGALVRTDLARWKKLVADAHIEAD